MILSQNSTQLDVYFKGERSYVQGSQVVTLAAAWCRNLVDYTEQWCLTKVSFSSFLVTNLELRTLEGEPETREPGFKGSLHFNDGFGSRLTMGVFESTVNKGVPPRVEDSPSLLESMELTGELSCRAAARHEGSLDQFFQALIAVNKRCHSLSFPGARNIYFAGLYDCGLPIEDKSYTAWCGFEITNRMLRKTSHSMMSLNHVRVTDGNGKNMKLNLIFNFETPK